MLLGKTKKNCFRLQNDLENYVLVVRRPLSFLRRHRSRGDEEEGLRPRGPQARNGGLRQMSVEGRGFQASKGEVLPRCNLL